MNAHQKIFLTALTSALLTTLSVSAADKYVGRCDVEFIGDSTLTAFTGHITNVPLTVICRTNNAGEALLNTRIEIGPRQLTTHNTKRDAHMYKMFLEDSFPKLIAAVTNAPLGAAKLSPSIPPADAGKLPVQLTFCGITKEVSAATTSPQHCTNGWEFDLETNVSLKDFKLKPPGMLLGAISVHDLVKVKAHVKVQQAPP